MTVNGKTCRDSFTITLECYCIAAIFYSSLIMSSETFKPLKVLAGLVLPSLHTGLYQQLTKSVKQEKILKYFDKLKKDQKFIRQMDDDSCINQCFKTTHS